MALFYNYTADIYSVQEVEVRGSMREEKIPKALNAKVAIWKSTNNFGQTTSATETNSNAYELNARPDTPVEMGDLVYFDGYWHKVEQVIKHHNYRGILDNYQAIITRTQDV